jgi:hypothetical protein
MLVSSGHLILASAIFKALFHSGLPAGQTTSQPRAGINLPGDDSRAFEILMNIIHGHVGKVPEQVDLEMMAKLSVLVDKYQVWQVMDLYVKMWMLKLEDSIPTSYTPDIMAWLSISWVFKLREVFRGISRIAQQESTARLSDKRRMHLPIPHAIIGTVQLCRWSTE